MRIWAKKIVDRNGAAQPDDRLTALSAGCGGNNPNGKNARMCRAYIIDRLFQHRVAAMKDLKETPTPESEEREPWLD